MVSTIEARKIQTCLVVSENKKIKILKPVGRVSIWQNLGQYEDQIN